MFDRIAEAFKGVNTHTKALAFTSLCVLALSLGFSAFLPEGHRVWVVITSTLALMLVAWTILALAKTEKAGPISVSNPPVISSPVPVPSILPQVDSEVVFERIKNRGELYRKACEMLNNAREYIVDTTWTRDVTYIAPQDDELRKTYRDAQLQAIKRGISYRELFVVTEGRQKLLSAARKLDDENNNYGIQEIEAPAHALSVLDFIVVDGCHLLLSHVEAADERPQQNYLYIKSQLLAGMFRDLFEVCWGRALRHAQQVKAAQATTEQADKRTQRPPRQK